MQKYQETIENLIKNHRKYQGCESILNKIVEEVYKQAEPIIGTVNDSAVIEGYLSKIVDKAMVTVPKKFNISTRTNRSRSIIIPDISDNEIEDELTLPEQTTETDETPILTEEFTDEPASELFENTIEESTEELTEEFIEEPVLENQDLNIAEENFELQSLEIEPAQELEFNELPEKDIAEESSEIDNYAIEETSQVDVQEPETEELSELISEPETKSDINIDLVDKMINGISPDNELEEDIFSDSDNEYENLNELTTEDSLSDEHPSLEAETENLELTDFMDSEEVQEVSEIAEDLNLQEDSETYNLEEISVKSDEKSAEFKLPDYSVFAYTPGNKTKDIESIAAKLENAEMPNNSEINVLQIASLKYKENKSVQDIADLLNLSKEDVLNVLDYASDVIEGD